MSEPKRIDEIRSSGESPDALPGSLGRVAAFGMAWMSLATVVGRLVGLIAQLVLGWILSQNDYGVYGLAVGVSFLVLHLRAIGTDRVLMQRGDQFDQLASPVAKLTTTVNVIAACILAIVAPLAADFYGSQDVQYLIWIIAFSLPIGVSAQIMRAKLSVRMEFRKLATVNMISFATRHLLVIALALAGFGPYSFAWPMIIMGLFDAALLRFVSGRWSRGLPLDRALLLELLHASKWILACGFASAIMTQGTTLVLGKAEDEATTGLFFFGLQLVLSATDLARSGMYSVLVPAFSRLTIDPARQAAAYRRATVVFVYVLAPICLAISLVSPAAIHLLWQGKWDGAAIVVQLLVPVLPVYLLFNLGGALLEARGQWRANAIVHGLNALGTLCAAFVGVWWGSIWETAFCLAAFRLAAGLAQTGWIVRLLDHSILKIWREVLSIWLSLAAAAGLAVLLLAYLLPGRFPQIPWWGVSAAAIPVFLASAGLLYGLGFTAPRALASRLLARARQT